MRDCIFFFMYLCRKMCKYGTEWNWRKKEWLTHACIPFAFPTDALLLHSIYVIIYSHSTDLIACLCIYTHTHTHTNATQTNIRLHVPIHEHTYSHRIRLKKDRNTAWYVQNSRFISVQPTRKRRCRCRVLDVNEASILLYIRSRFVVSIWNSQ